MGITNLKQEASLSTVTLTSGDGTLDVTFDNPFDEAPVVLLTINDDDWETTDKYTSLNASSIVAGGFTIEIESASDESSVDIAWFAMEKRSDDRT